MHSVTPSKHCGNLLARGDSIGRHAAEQPAQHLVCAFLAQRVEPQLRIVGLVAPLMAVLGPIVDQLQDARGADAVSEQLQECLRLVIDPVKVFEISRPAAG